jgi:hypothetical protein
MPVQNKLQKNAEGISGDDYIKKNGDQFTSKENK